MINEYPDSGAQMHKSLRYQVDPAKGVLYTLRGRPLSNLSRYGYVMASRGGRNTPAHRVIWEHVHGPIPPGMEINHINGIKTDNRIENLEAVTPSENIRHAYRTGLNVAPRGALSTQAKLTLEEVESVRTRHAAGERVKALALEFNVSKDALYAILAGRTWLEAERAIAAIPTMQERQLKPTHEPIAPTPGRRDLSGLLFDTLLAENGLASDAALCRKLGVSNAAVSKTRNGVYPVSDPVILKVYDVFGLSIERIRELIRATPGLPTHVNNEESRS